MSQEILIKRIEAVAGQREIERIQAIADEEEREDVFLKMVYSSDPRFERVMYRGESIAGLYALYKIEGSFGEEMRRKTDTFFGSLPDRVVPFSTPLPLGKSYPVTEEQIEGWFLNRADIRQLIELGRAIDAYFEAEIAKMEALEQKERYLRDIWGYTARWMETLEDVGKSDYELLVWMV